VPQQVAEELHDLRSPDGPTKKLEVELPPRHSGNRREVVPVKVILQNRSLSSRSPGAADVGSLAQPALVDEDDGPTFLAGFFLMAGQRYLFQCRMASSSRSNARPVGRWQLQPNCPRIRQTCPGWYRTPHRFLQCGSIIIYRKPNIQREDSAYERVGSVPQKPDVCDNSVSPPICYDVPYSFTDVSPTNTVAYDYALARADSSGREGEISKASLAVPLEIVRDVRRCREEPVDPY
jgi:hypothetical protein